LHEEPRLPVLLCATLWWPSSARLAMSFLRHGCDVSAICPPGHPLRYVTGMGEVFTYRSFSSIHSLKVAIRSAQPVLIVPCDDGAVWQLHALHASEPDLRSLIEHSLGAAEAYPTIQKRGEVLRVASELGIRVPFTQTVRSVEDLKGWCLDAPAVLKLDGTWGGEGVAIVRSEQEAIQGYRAALGATRASVAWKRFLVNRHPVALWSWRRQRTASIHIQEFIPGQPATTMFACWRGEVLGSTTVEVLASQGVTGAATVVRPLEHSAIENAARLLAHKFKLSGFHGLDFILEKGTGAACLIELNPRSTQLGHLNLSAQGDLAGVLAAKLRNEAADPGASEDRIGDSTIAFFPHAFKANPKSAYLCEGYHDVPWEEPALVWELVRDSWPDRQWLSRIYHYFRAKKQLDLAHEMFQPVDSKSHS
jgi:predicted ATP-grasp superfamily ATP-dependent carboligase